MIRAVESNVPLIKPGDRSSVIVQAAGGITDGGVTLSAVKSAIADFSLVFTPTQLRLRANVDFATPGRTLNRNQTAVGDYFNRIQNAGSIDVLATTIAKLFYTPDAATLARIYDSYDGEVYADVQAATTFSADRFVQRLKGCRENGIVQGGGCVWMTGGDGQFSQGTTAAEPPVRRYRRLRPGRRPSTGWATATCSRALAGG